MSRSGPIVIVEDDRDDQFIMEKIFQGMGVPNQRVYFTSCDDAFTYLQTTVVQPCIIISDVNLPRQSGIEFKRQIDQDPELRMRSIPFVFLSTSAEPKSVTEAYTKMTVQGFFQKPDTYEKLTQTIQLIIDYWLLCKHPNSA